MAARKCNLKPVAPRHWRPGAPGEKITGNRAQVASQQQDHRLHASMRAMKLSSQ